MKARNDRAHRVLFVDDDSLFVDASAEILRSRGYIVETAGTLQRAASHDPSRFGAVVVDHNLPDGEGLTLARRFDLRKTRVVMVSASQPFAAAVGALRLGVADFLSKPLDMDELVRVIESPLAAPVTGDLAGDALIPSLRRRKHFLTALSRSRCPVLVSGETGTGKGYVARAIHGLGSGTRPFVAVNCAAIPATLVESELFGVERGAFTGAESRPGLFEQAHEGTVFLDEIGELPLPLQSKLLSFLDDGLVRRVGGVTSRSVDVRIIAATNRDLDQDVTQGAFRSDLLHRLDVARFELEPLRARMDDLPELLSSILLTLSARDRVDYELAAGELDRLATYDWPGNVREMRNVVERSTLTTPHLALEPSSVLRDRRQPSPPPAVVAAREATLSVSLDAVERAHVLRVLELCEGNRTMAASALGMGVSTLRRKLADWSKG
jgi:DNA-binding NtrC family response regulator